jgi:hypothetical protein
VTVFLGSAPISTASAPACGGAPSGAEGPSSPASRSRRLGHGARLQSARRRPGSGPCPSRFGVVAESWKDASPMGAPLFLAAFLVTVALLLAPERPEAQEAICNRHAGVEACRVW